MTAAGPFKESGPPAHPYLSAKTHPRHPSAAQALHPTQKILVNPEVLAKVPGEISPSITSGDPMNNVSPNPLFLMSITNPQFNVIPALLITVLALCNEAKSAAIITVFESGRDVVVLGSGSLDLNGLYFEAGDANSITGRLNGGAAALLIGQGGYAAYAGSSGPSSFGQPQISTANDSEGDLFGVGARGGLILVPFLYSSGSPLLASSTWRESSIASLGLTPGLYTYTWTTGIGLMSESLTVNIIPEPSSFCVFGSLLVAAMLRRSRRMGQAVQRSRR